MGSTKVTCMHVFFCVFSSLQQSFVRMQVWELTVWAFRGWTWLCTEGIFPQFRSGYTRYTFFLYLISNFYREKVVSNCCFLFLFFVFLLHTSPTDFIVRSQFVTRSLLHHASREAREMRGAFYLAEEGITADGEVVREGGWWNYGWHGQASTHA